VSSEPEALKSELEHFGEANDQATRERSRRMLNITRDTGEFLSVPVRATGARRVLEIGRSNGYSTLWLAGFAARRFALLPTPVTGSRDPRRRFRSTAMALTVLMVSRAAAAVAPFEAHAAADVARRAQRDHSWRHSPLRSRAARADWRWPPAQRLTNPRAMPNRCGCVSTLSNSMRPMPA
jgi:hypothetical protein